MTADPAGRTLPHVFSTELTKRRAVDLVRVAAMLCPMP
ncbi:MAG TPA: putative leader peptide [Jiangellales bacterium]|nr:putative leader peptide [Jiangellales bacterium]